VYLSGLLRPAKVGCCVLAIARFALLKAAMAWKTALLPQLTCSACRIHPLAGDMISMGPAMRVQKKSNALRSESVIENDSMDGGGEGVTEYERDGLIVSVRDELLPDKASSPLADGLLDAGKRGRDVPALPGGNAL
jgi:hypothetical protein